MALRVLLLLLLTLTSSVSHAASVRQLRQQLETAETARSLAESERAAALTDVETLSRQLSQVEHDNARFAAALASERASHVATEAERARLQAERDRLESEYNSAQRTLAEQAAALDQALRTRAQTRADSQRADAALADRSVRLQACGQSTVGLGALVRNLFVSYREKSCFESSDTSTRRITVWQRDLDRLLDWQAAAPAAETAVPPAAPAQTDPLSVDDPVVPSDATQP